MPAAIRVLSVASEFFPLIKTGGLADVAGALPGALATQGIQMVALLPLYPAVQAQLKRTTVEHRYTDFFGGPARILSARHNGLDLLLLDAPHLFDRPGNPYTEAGGKDWQDNSIRFAALSRAAASIGQGLLRKYTFDIVHCHDWQAGLTPAYLYYDGGPRPRTVMTVHNLAFQGQFPRSLLQATGLPDRAYVYDGVEYYGTIGYLKSGLQFADRITTVSPTYAAEIREPEAGMGLEGLLNARSRDLSGIINGIDVAVWNPENDPALPATFSAREASARVANKSALQRRFGIDERPEALLIGIVSRLSWQKGLDLVLEAIPSFINNGCQLVVLGSGDTALETGFHNAARIHPDAIACQFGYDEALAHQIQAGSDAILVPSRFEPCGLTQLCALRYGAVPIVTRVGGLADTVIDANEMALSNGVATGIQFPAATTGGLIDALSRSAHLFARKDAWAQIQANGMRTDVSWNGPAQRYAELYRSLLVNS